MKNCKLTNEYYSCSFYFQEWKQQHLLELEDLFDIFNDKVKNYKIPLYFDTFCLFIFNHSTHNVVQ